MRQKIICECCGIIGYKTDDCIIYCPKLLPPSLRRNMNQFNDLNGEEPTEPSRKCNRQLPAAHFKSITSTPKTMHVVSAFMGILNHHAVDNGDVEFQLSEFPV